MRRILATAAVVLAGVLTSAVPAQAERARGRLGLGTGLGVLRWRWVA